MKRPFLEVIRSASKTPVLQKQLHAVVKRRWFRFAGIAFAVLVLALIALPFLINVNSFRPQIESEATKALGRQVKLGDLSLSILSGSVVVKDISIADDPAFSNSPFVTAKALKVGVELMPLIFSKQIKVTHITLEKPEIMMVKTAGGKWNFSTIGGGSSEKTQTQTNSDTSQMAGVSVARLDLKDGKLSVRTANSSAKPAVLDKVDISVKNFSFTSEFPFELKAQLPTSGDVKISGKAGPINTVDDAKTPLTATVKVNSMNIGALGVIDPATGIAGTANLDGTLTSDGSRAKAVGLLTGRQLKFSPKGTPTPKPVTVKYTVTFDLAKQSGTISQGDVAIGSAQAHVTGTFRSEGEATVLNLKLDAPNMPVDELQPMLPSVGVVLPSGSQLKGGTLSAQLAIEGPLDKLVITGPVRLANTELANFNLGSQLGSLSAFAGKAVSNPNTAVQNASLDAKVSPAGTKADNINLNVPAIGVITGAGTVSPAGDLAFKMLANLQGGVVGGLSKVAGAASGKGGVPFSIEGTTSNPKFVPDLGGAVGGAVGAVGGLAKDQLGNVAKAPASGVKNVSKGIGGILGKKN